MKRRLFIAINLPDKTKDEIARIADKWTELPVRWTEKDNLHITLCFLDEVDESDIPSIKEKITESAKTSEPLPISITNISLGPNEFSPKMIWANGEVTDKFKSLVKDIHSKLGECGCNENKINNFKLHITLARIGNDRGRFDHIPPIRETIDVNFVAESIELMESNLGQDGSSYKVLETFSLK